MAVVKSKRHLDKPSPTEIEVSQACENVRRENTKPSQDPRVDRSSVSPFITQTKQLRPREVRCLPALYDFLPKKEQWSFLGEQTKLSCVTYA